MASVADVQLRSGVFEAAVSTRGAVITRFGFRRSGDFVPVIDGFVDDAELAEFDGYRSAVLAPWSNRISDARYTFQGHSYDLGPAEDGSREALHGLVALSQFQVVSAAEDRVTLQTHVEPVEGYPWPVRVSVSYQLSEDGLKLIIEGRNDSDTDAPIGLGWHPYFATRGQWRSSLPVASEISVDDRLIPLEGDAAFESVFSPAAFEDRRNVDTGFTDLQGGPAVLVTSDYELHMSQNSPAGCNGVGIFHLYSGDFLRLRRYESVALEPCQFMTDAFNRELLKSKLTVAPGHSTRLEVQLSVRDVQAGA